MLHTQRIESVIYLFPRHVGVLLALGTVVVGCVVVDGFFLWNKGMVLIHVKVYVIVSTKKAYKSICNMGPMSNVVEP